MRKNQQKTLLTTLLLSVIVVLATTQTFAQNRISKAKRVSQNVVLSRSTMNRTAASSAERAPIAANHARFNQNAIQPSGSNSTSLTITSPAIVAIDPSQIGITHWTISPNPSNSWFTIDMRLAHGDDIYLTITDMNGRVVFSENQINIKEIHESVRLNVASGAYTVQVYTSKGTASKRIIVQ